MFERVLKSWSTIDPRQKQQQQAPKPKKESILPDQISSRILDLQIQCQKQTITKEIVFELIAQYSKAIQFYEQKGNDKYRLYRKRMQNFLAKPVISSILKGQSGQMIIKKEKNQQTIRKAENGAEKQAKQLLLKQQQKQKKHQIIIKQEINKQEQVLQERIRKKRANSNRSMQEKKSETGFDNQQSAKKQAQKLMQNRLLINGLSQRSSKVKKVFF